MVELRNVKNRSLFWLGGFLAVVATMLVFELMLMLWLLVRLLVAVAPGSLARPSPRLFVVHG